MLDIRGPFDPLLHIYVPSGHDLLINQCFEIRLKMRCQLVETTIRCLRLRFGDPTGEFLQVTLSLHAISLVIPSHFVLLKLTGCENVHM